MTDDTQAKADRMVADWSRDKKDFATVRQRMGEVINADLDLIRTGRSGLGTVRDGNIDLDAAYDIARRTHHLTRDRVRSEEKAAREGAMAESW